MDVSSTIFQPIFEGVKQYVVPLFQKNRGLGLALRDGVFACRNEYIAGVRKSG